MSISFKKNALETTNFVVLQTTCQLLLKEMLNKKISNNTNLSLNVNSNIKDLISLHLVSLFFLNSITTNLNGEEIFSLFIKTMPFLFKQFAIVFPVVANGLTKAQLVSESYSKELVIYEDLESFRSVVLQNWIASAYAKQFSDKVQTTILYDTLLQAAIDSILFNFFNVNNSTVQTVISQLPPNTNFTTIQEVASQTFTKSLIEQMNTLLSNVNEKANADNLLYNTLLNNPDSYPSNIEYRSLMIRNYSFRRNLMLFGTSIFNKQNLKTDIFGEARYWYWGTAQYEAWATWLVTQRNIFRASKGFPLYSYEEYITLNQNSKITVKGIDESKIQNDIVFDRKCSCGCCAAVIDGDCCGACCSCGFESDCGCSNDCGQCADFIGGCNASGNTGDCGGTVSYCSLEAYGTCC